jgi:hypothetical protein
LFTIFHQPPAPPAVASHRKKRPYEVGHEDDATLLFFDALKPVHLSSAEELKTYLAIDSNVQKLKINNDLDHFEYWY